MDKEKIICMECKSENVVIQYGLDDRYPDDYSIDCLECDNWEEGNGTIGSFTVEELD